jgi:hypothetical protein
MIEVLTLVRFMEAEEFLLRLDFMISPPIILDVCGTGKVPNDCDQLARCAIDRILGKNALPNTSSTWTTSLKLRSNAPNGSFQGGFTYLDERREEIDARKIEQSKIAQ